MITPKEKAKELVGMYDTTLGTYQGFLHSKKCALICVAEMKASHKNWSTEQWEVYDELDELKKEIENL